MDELNETTSAVINSESDLCDFIRTIMYELPKNLKFNCDTRKIYK